MWSFGLGSFWRGGADIAGGANTCDGTSGGGYLRIYEYTLRSTVILCMFDVILCI
jgi:hypothetical protein